MGQRHVLITFNHAPYGSIFYTEGLRAAVGVTSGIDEHTVDVLYLGDGVRFVTDGVDRKDSNLYLSTLSSLDVNLKAEREALQERNIGESELAEGVEIVSRDEVLELVRQADLTIDF
jgi:sulfur relay (sulfurtransferase) DsrF/TusC family protein